MPKRLSKRDRACLRDLAAEAHQNELEEALAELYDEFCTWGGKGMSPFDLNEKIHEYHDGISRELYKIYVMSPPEIAVAIGISRRTINLDDLENHLREIVCPASNADNADEDSNDESAT